MKSIKDINYYLSKDKSLFNVLNTVLKILTAYFYILFPVQLLLLSVYDTYFAISLLILDAIYFLILTAVRKVINAPRPYENSGYLNLTGKKTKGKSYPSRHCFSSWLITCNNLLLAIYLDNNILYFLFFVDVIFCSYIMIVRVLFGIHHGKDVVAGMLCGWLCFFLYFALML